MSLDRKWWSLRKRQRQSKLFGRNIVRLSRPKGSRFYLEIIRKKEKGKEKEIQRELCKDTKRVEKRYRELEIDTES